MNIFKNVSNYIIGNNSLKNLKLIFDQLNITSKDCIFFIDIYHKNKPLFKKISFANLKNTYFISTLNEPTDTDIDQLLKKIKIKSNKPKVIIGIGGGSTLDTAKAVSVMLNNFGKTSKYQGWNLPSKKGIYKIGIPTISGTGAESSRTCVLVNNVSKMKLGINSNYSVYDTVVLDPSLIKTVAKKQYFYTAMDTFFHSFESLKGNHRNQISDAYSEQAITLIDEIFSNTNFKSFHNREKLMVASYLGGLAIAGSYVGVLHPISAGISTILKTPHCYTNCIVMKKMKDFYPNELKIYNKYLKINKMIIPDIDFSIYDDDILNQIYLASVVHSKPLVNALGKDYKKILTFKYFKNLLKNY
mgnify:CR=1 FL=1